MENSMFPSEPTISKGQCGKLMDVGVDALVKSGLPHAPTQYVLEHESAEIAANLVTDVRRRVETRIRTTEPHILRRQPFDPEKFIGKGWTIDDRVGRRNGDNLDAGMIVGKHYLKKGESSINGEERLKRIKAVPADIQLDGDDFLALWQEEGHKTLNWLFDTKGMTWLSFWGVILRGPDGGRYVLYLYRHEYGSWRWICDWVDYGSWYASSSSAVLASS